MDTVKRGLPTISFRDVTIHRTADDLIGASFGRGYYILDDIAPLRDYDATKANEVQIFEPKTAYWYMPIDGLYGQGDNSYKAENPPFGAVITYFLPEKYNSSKEDRVEKEKALNEQNASVPFPGWDALSEEKNSDGPSLRLLIKNGSGEVINMVEAPNKKGFNRANWDLSLASKTGISLQSSSVGEMEEFMGSPFKATPGKYTAELVKVDKGTMVGLAGPVSITVERLKEGRYQPNQLMKSMILGKITNNLGKI